MEKKNKIVLIAISVLTVCVIGFCIYSVLNNKKVDNNDAIKFMNEYTELNGKKNEYNNLEYVKVELSENNTVKYVTEDEAVEILEKGTGVIYFGFSMCPWCRSLVTTLAKVAEEKEETIYYLDILDIRSTFEIKDNKLNKKREGSKGYYQILKELDSELEDYYLEDEKGNKYDTEEKRLYAPTLVAVKNGEVTKIHVGTVETQLSGFDPLTTDQLDELENIIENLINSKNNEICTEGKC